MVLVAGGALAALTAGCVPGSVASVPPAPLLADREAFGPDCRWAPAALPSSPGPIRQLWEVRDPAGLRGFAADLGLRGRSGRFTVRLLTDARARVLAVRVVHYPHARGAGIRRAAFTRQFAGLGPDSPIRLGEDVDAVSGATISSRAVARGVREALHVLARRAERQGTGQ